MKVYGSHICIDCRNYQALQARRGFAAEFIDITANTANLKDFLALRDHDPVFVPVRGTRRHRYPALCERGRPQDLRTWTRPWAGSVSRRYSRRKWPSSARLRRGRAAIDFGISDKDTLLTLAKTAKFPVGT